MRPKKTILCVDDNEQVLSVRTFLLETRGYRIIAVKTAQVALEVLEQSLPGTVDAFDRALHADVFLPKGASSPAEMIERIRVLVARKRGPKKANTPASSQ